MFARHPKMAKEWQAHTGKGKLPEKVASLTDYYKIATGARFDPEVNKKPGKTPMARSRQVAGYPHSGNRANTQ